MARKEQASDAVREAQTAEALGITRGEYGADDAQVSTEVTPAVSGEIAVGGPAMRNLIEWLAERAAGDDEDTFGAMERIIAETLTAENPDEVLSARLPVHARDVVGIPMSITGFRLNEGDFEEGSPFYAVMDATYGTPPEPHVVTCGAWRVLAALKRLDELGEWPQTVVFREKRTKSGNGVLWFERPKV